MKDLKDFDVMQSKEIREGILHPTEEKKMKVLIKYFIKCMSNELGDINETIVRVSADASQKELALARKMKVHLVKGFNLLVQLEQAMKESDISSCKVTSLQEDKRLEYEDLHDPKKISI